MGDMLDFLLNFTISRVIDRPIFAPSFPALGGFSRFAIANDQIFIPPLLALMIFLPP
jgi:hypothetical protein